MILIQKSAFLTHGKGRSIIPKGAVDKKVVNDNYLWETWKRVEWFSEMFFYLFFFFGFLGIQFFGFKGRKDWKHLTLLLPFFPTSHRIVFPTFCFLIESGKWLEKWPSFMRSLKKEMSDLVIIFFLLFHGIFFLPITNRNGFKGKPEK